MKKCCQKHVTVCHLIHLSGFYFHFTSICDFMNTKKVTKHPFSIEEDRALMNYVMMYGASNWVQIAMLMNGRTQKQCRERWVGHLCPSVNTGPWTLEEDKILAQKHSEIGNKWARIATFLPGRTDILVKNRWNTSVKQRVQNGDLIIQTPPTSVNNTENVQSQATKSTFIIPSFLKPIDNYDIDQWLNSISSRHHVNIGSCPILITNLPK